MSTFINPGKIRELAATGDAFYRGAAWILDQQAAQAEAREEALEAGLARMAARIDETDYDSEWTRNEVALNPHSEEYRRLARVLADVTAVDALTDYDLNT